MEEGHGLSMGTLVTVLALVAIVAIMAGSSGRSAVRRASRAFSLLGTVFFGLIAAACLYGAFATGRRGGGVLLFLAVPAAIIAWLFFAAFTSSRETETFLELPLDEQQARTDASMAADIARHRRDIALLETAVQAFWTPPGKRQRLRNELTLARIRLEGLLKLQAARKSQEGGEPLTDGESPLHPR